MRAERSVNRTRLFTELGYRWLIEACRATGSNPADVVNTLRRSPQVLLQRELVIVWLRDVKGLSYPEIGEAIQSTHSTAIKAYTRVKARGYADVRMAADAEARRVTRGAGTAADPSPAAAAIRPASAPTG